MGRLIFMISSKVKSTSKKKERFSFLFLLLQMCGKDNAFSIAGLNGVSAGKAQVVDYSIRNCQNLLKIVRGKPFVFLSGSNSWDFSPFPTPNPDGGFQQQPI